MPEESGRPVETRLGLVPELLAIVVSAAYLCGVLGRKDRTDGISAWARLLNVLGFLSTSSLILLGAIWPSLFTLLAILVLPAPVFFLVATLRSRPRVAAPWMRAYLTGSVAASGISWIVEFWWEFLR